MKGPGPAGGSDEPGFLAKANKSAEVQWPERVKAAARKVDYGQLRGFVGAPLSGVVTAGSDPVFLLALLLFLSTEASSVGDRLTVVTGGHPDMGGVLAGFTTATRGYPVVSTVFGAIVVALDSIAPVLLGVPVPVVWGLLVFVTNCLPNVCFFSGPLPLRCSDSHGATGRTPRSSQRR